MPIRKLTGEYAVMGAPLATKVCLSIPFLLEAQWILYFLDPAKTFVEGPLACDMIRLVQPPDTWSIADVPEI